MTQHPLLIPGQLHPNNKMTMDWGPNKLVAYSSWNCIIIADPKMMRRIHTLDKHNKIITKLKWSDHDLIPSSLNDYILTLASGDESGNVFIWNVNDGIIQSELKDEDSKFGKVLDFIWHPYQRNLLYTLYSTYNNTSVLVLWDISSLKMRWKYTFNTNIISISLNPFNHTQMCAFNPVGHIYFIKDLKDDLQPHRVILKYKISTSPTGSDDTSESFNQMIYSPYIRHLAYFLLDYRILIFDLSLNQSIGSINIDSKKSAFKQLLISKNDYRVIFTLHEDGTLSSWVKKESLNPSYSLKTSIDVLKVTRRKRDPNVLIHNASLSSIDNEMNIILLSSDGCLWNVLFEQIKDIHGNVIDEQFCIIGQLESISGQISSFSPFYGYLKGDNSGNKVNLLAVGLKDGRIMIFDILKQQMIRCFKSNHGLQIRGIRWIHSDKIIYFTFQSVDKGMYKSRIVQLNITTGQETEIRKKKELEPTFIKGLRLSPSKTYLIILFKDFNIQLWDIKSGILIKTFQLKAVAVEWAIMTEQQESSKECFAIATSNGIIHLRSVDNGVIQEFQNSIDAGMGINEITCLSWRNNLLIVGNTADVIQCFDLNMKKLHVIECKETIHRTIFSSDDQNNHVITLFKDGDFSVLDLNQKSFIFSNFKSRDLRSIGIDWLNDSSIVVACSDGSFRIIDKSFSSFNNSSNSPIMQQYPLFSPLVLEPEKSLYLKSLLLHKDLKEGDEFYHIIDEYMLNQINSKDKTIDRALSISNYFGFTKESRFWMLTAKSLDDFAYINEEEKTIEIDPFNQETQDDTQLQNEDENIIKETTKNINNLSFKEGMKLPNYFDLLMDPNQLKDTYRERSLINLNDNIKDEKKIQKMVEFNLQLGEKEKAIELLLETDHNHPKYIINMLKACIIASMISKEVSQNTLKRVAASFIASGNISDGVQLLVLAGKGLDACRYLQSFDKWIQSALLAKLTLNYKEYKIVYDRWAEFLLSSGNSDNAIEILLSLGEYMKVINILYESKYYETAVIFIKVLKEENIILDELEKNKELIKNIYKEYGQILNNIGYKKKSEYYLREGEENEKDIIIL